MTRRTTLCLVKRILACALAAIECMEGVQGIQTGVCSKPLTTEELRLHTEWGEVDIYVAAKHTASESR